MSTTFLSKWLFEARQIEKAYGRKNWLTRLKLALGIRTSVLLPYLKRLPAGSEVLEVGCGSGMTLYLLAHHYGFCPFGIDADGEAVKQAQATLSELGYARMADNIRQAYADALPFGENRFDGLYTNDVLGHVPDPPRVLAEMYRVLKPGGRLALHSETNGYHRARWAWQHVAMQALGGQDPWVELDLHISLMPGERIVELVKAQGFIVDKVCYASESLLLFNFVGPRPDPSLYERFPQVLNHPLAKWSERFRRFYEACYRVPGVQAIHRLMLMALMTLLTYTLPYDSNGVFVLARKPEGEAASVF